MEYQTKILIADENAAQRQALCKELARAGYKNIEEASNGEEALIKIGRYHPDVAIIDIWLSKLDGIGVLRNCKNINFAPDRAPAFIVVSMVSNQSIFMEASESGADYCMLKPYNVESLCGHINSLAAARTTFAASLSFLTYMEKMMFSAFARSKSMVTFSVSSRSPRFTASIL